MTVEERLARAFIDTHAPQAAVTLEQMPLARAAVVLESVPAPLAAKVVHEMTAPHAASLLGRIQPAVAAEIVTEMTVDEGAAIARAMDAEHREPLLAALSPHVRDPIETVIGFPEGTAGAVMDPSVFQIPDDVLVADARTRLRTAARELLYYLYVVDREHRLVGVLDIPELMLAPPRGPVSAAMHRNVDRLPAWLPVALVIEHPGWQRYHAMPVVDEEQRLLGAIRYQTVRRLERLGAERVTAPGLVTARALGELFQIGTTGLVAGVAGTASAAVGDNQEVGDRADATTEHRDA